MRLASPRLKVTLIACVVLASGCATDTELRSSQADALSTTCAAFLTRRAGSPRSPGAAFADDAAFALADRNKPLPPTELLELFCRAG